MRTLVQLFNEWEIQLLVLLSFTLQIFLFFTGDLRRCSTNKFLRLLICFSYLGADLVAVYALGLLSRHEDDTAGMDTLIGTHELAFFWAPFLLIHLGGQDIITAFAMEDNNLWLRHLLNLVVYLTRTCTLPVVHRAEATLALYIFWKSTGSPNMQLVVPSILLFVTGTIKYGERTWALWCGSLQSLASSTVPTYVEQLAETVGSVACYSEVIICALNSIRGVHDVFAESIIYHYSLDHRGRGGLGEHPDLLPKLLEIELCLMYDDMYTKAMVLRTRGSIVLRCVSQASYLVAFVLFSVSNKQRYNPADTAVIRRVANEKLWISKMVDTNFVEVDEEIMRCVIQWVVQYSSNRSSILKPFPNVGPLLEQIISRNGRLESVIFFLHIYTEVQFNRYSPTGVQSATALVRMCRMISNYMLYLWIMHPEMLPVKKGKFEKFNDAESIQMTSYDVNEFASTENLSSNSHRRSDDIMRRGIQMADYVDEFASTENLSSNSHRRSDDIIRRGIQMLSRSGLPEPPPYCSEAQMLEIHEAWIQLLVYAAGKSRPEMHAAQLARGGELLSFVWLLMAHHLFGDVGERIEIADIFNLEEARIPTGLAGVYLYD